MPRFRSQDWRVELLLGFLMFVFFSSWSAADTLQDRMVWWRTQAFSCSTPFAFPSKNVQAGDCEDGDMTLFNGLLCAAGEKIGCDAVKAAQGADGRWWRSPRRIGMENPPHPPSFSPDQVRGILLYALTMGDVTSFDRWVHWVDDKRPCWVKFGNCLLKGWPRVCPDDAPQKGCTFRIGTCSAVEEVGKFIHSSKGELCRNVLDEFAAFDPGGGKWVHDFVYPTGLLSAGAAAVNDNDYPLHLAAVDLFILSKIDPTSDGLKYGAPILALRDPDNPFFLYLAKRPSADIESLLLRVCPSPAQPSTLRFQWSWERPSASKPWLQSMYWDCIFIGKLLGAA